MAHPSDMREGPVEICGQLRCIGCRHYTWRTFRSGRYRTEYNFCQHPVATEDRGGRLELYNVTGACIGEKDRTPSWCPVGVAEISVNPESESGKDGVR